MRKRRKTDHCLNCEKTLNPSFNYCPECGQENNSNQLSFRQLLTDFFANYFSLDSRFGRSVKPFFFQPGVLTREFMEGKRAKYANPIRLYLVVSLVHFFVFSLSSNLEDSPDSVGFLKEQTETDSVKTKNLITYSTDEEREPLDSLILHVPDSGYFALSSDNLRIIKELGESYSMETIMDTLNTHNRPFWERILVKQVIKAEKKGAASFMVHVVKNIPILMFFLLPIYALILKIFFRKRLYINHVVHSLHVHSLLFILLTPFWFYGIFSDPPEFIIAGTFLVSSLYLVVSFHNTYVISWRTAILKVFFSGWLYSMVLFIALLFTFLVSFLTF